MSGFKRKFLGAIGIELGPAETTTVTTKEKATAPAVKTTNFNDTSAGQFTSQTIQTDVGTYSGSPTNQALEYFANLLKEKNLQGNDYVEFIEATQDEGLKAFPTEQNRYIAAFVGLKRAPDGLTKEKLIETAMVYQKLIDEDLIAMDVAFEEAYKTQVDGKKIEMEKRNTRMQELSLEIEKLNSEAQQLNQEAMESESTLQANKNSFAMAAKITKEKITKEIDKINLYIQQ